MGRLLAENERQNTVNLRKSLDSSSLPQQNDNAQHAVVTTEVSKSSEGQDPTSDNISNIPGKEPADKGT